MRREKERLVGREETLQPQRPSGDCELLSQVPDSRAKHLPDEPPPPPRAVKEKPVRNASWSRATVGNKRTVFALYQCWRNMERLVTKGAIRPPPTSSPDPGGVGAAIFSDITHDTLTTIPSPLYISTCNLPKPCAILLPPGNPFPPPFFPSLLPLLLSFPLLSPFLCPSYPPCLTLFLPSPSSQPLFLSFSSCPQRTHRGMNGLRSGLSPYGTRTTLCRHWVNTF